jgi:hypothetical protein
VVSDRTEVGHETDLGRTPTSAHRPVARTATAPYPQCPSRQALTHGNRAIVLAKTAGRCHLCGGHVAERWTADHVLAHSGGGRHAVDNYLPAHALCIGYRWSYLPEEFQWALKISVWAPADGEALCVWRSDAATSIAFINIASGKVSKSPGRQRTCRGTFAKCTGGTRTGTFQNQPRTDEPEYPIDLG